MLIERLEAEPSINDAPGPPDIENQYLQRQFAEIEQELGNVLRKCKQIYYLILLVGLYSLSQFILIIVLLCIPEIYSSNSMGTRYLCICLLQYSSHIHLLYKLRAYNSDMIKSIESPAQSRAQRIAQYVQIFENVQENVEVWGYLIKKTYKIYFVNKVLYLLLFFVGNVLFLTKSTELPNYVFWLQLAIGWCLIMLGLFIISLVCIALPILIIVHQYNERRRQQNRTTTLRLILQRTLKYKDLEVKPEQPCCICMCEYEPNEEVVQLPCRIPHTFHVECLKPWAETKDTCPFCRSPLV